MSVIVPMFQCFVVYLHYNGVILYNEHEQNIIILTIYCIKSNKYILHKMCSCENNHGMYIYNATKINSIINIIDSWLNIVMP